MSDLPNAFDRPAPARRRFLQTGAALGAASLLAAARALPAHAAGDEPILKLALIGCGGRGSGAAAQALEADGRTRLVAMADAFEDRLAQSLDALNKSGKFADRIDVPPERRFVGFDAFQPAIAAADVVLLATPPHFRPLHIEAAIAAGKHVFAEKPVAVDAPGVRRVLAACREARSKNLSVVSGLALRMSRHIGQIVDRVRDGAVGRVVALQANDYRGPIWVKPREPGMSDMTWHMRNWYYFTWLSGDFNVEQHIHMLDLCAMLRGDEYPVRAIGTGGRVVRTGPEFGNIFDHFAVTYEYADGVRLFATCRQQANCHSEISAEILGSDGQARLATRRPAITGPRAWSPRDEDNNPFLEEHVRLFQSIRAGSPINHGEYMARSTLMAIQGRMAAYTGRAVTWDEAMQSKEDLTPASYEWNAAPPDSPIAIPGVTRLV
jgi:predicted dehydrogenase